MSTEPALTADAPGTSARFVAGVRRRADLLIAIGLAFASLLVGVVHVPQHTTVSPIDEYVYIDAVAKVPTQLVVRRGEEVGDFARRYLACHSVRLIGFYPEWMCEASNTDQDAEYPNGGLTSADIYLPAYFASTWLIAQPLTWFGIDLVDSARLVGVLWLALAAVALYFAMRRLLVPRMLAAALPLLLVGSLPAYWSNTYVSTDATALAAGAVLLLVALRVRDRVTSLWWFVGLSAAFTAFKLQNLVAVAAVGLFLMLTAAGSVVAESPRGERLRTWLRHPLVWGSAVAVVVSALVQVAWVVVRGAIAAGPAAVQGVDSQLSVLALAKELFRFIPGMATGASSPDALAYYGVLIAGVLALIVSGGVVGAIGADRGLSTTSNIGVSVLAVATVAAPALAVLSASISGEYVQLVGRYGMSLLPVALAAFAVLFAERRWVRIPVLVVAVGLYLLSLRIGG